VRLWREIFISPLRQRRYSDFGVISKMLRISIKNADFLRKWVNFGTECARFSIKRAGVLKWVFENIRKRSKTFKNIQKLGENIRKYSNFLQVLAHLIDF